MIQTLDEKRLTQLGVLDWGYVENMTPLSYGRYEQWVEAGNHGSLKYLSDQRKNARDNLKNVFEDAQSSLVFLFGYHERKAQDLQQNQNVASYVTAFGGRDYHSVMHEKLMSIGEDLKKELSINFHIAVDTKPILERDFAYQAGLGWFGKNSMLLNRQSGSYFMIGVLLLDRKLEVSTKPLQSDHCGNCRACIDACPTNAIMEKGRTLLAERCISTFTIEHFKDTTPPVGYEGTPYIFGCDICQDVCPWSKKSIKNYKFVEKHTDLDDKLKRIDSVEWLESISNREFRRIFKDTPMERTGRVGLLKNIKRKNTTS